MKMKLIIFWSASIILAYSGGYFFSKSDSISLKPLVLETHENQLTPSEYKNEKTILLKKQAHDPQKTESLLSDHKKILAEVKSLLAGGSFSLDLASISKSYALVSEFSELEVSNALSEMKGNLNHVRNAMYLNLLISRYAELNPYGAIDFIENNVSSPRNKKLSLNSAIRTWAKHDPTSAYYWVVDNKNNENDFMSSYKYVALFSGLAKQDVNDAYSKLNEIANKGKDTDMAAMGLANVLEDSESFSVFYENSKFLDSKNVMNSAIATWINKDPLVATEWLDSIDEGEDKRKMQDAALNNWINSEPRKAVDWYMSHGNGDERQSYANKVVTSWGRTDPKQTLEWINQQPNIDKEIVTTKLLQSSVYSNIQFAIDNTKLLSSEKSKKSISSTIYLNLKRSNKKKAERFLNDSPYKEYLLSNKQNKRNKQITKG